MRGPVGAEAAVSSLAREPGRLLLVSGSRIVERPSAWLDNRLGSAMPSTPVIAVIM
jgi:hypothetical protein